MVAGADQSKAVSYRKQTSRMLGICLIYAAFFVGSSCSPLPLVPAYSVHRGEPAPAVMRLRGGWARGQTKQRFKAVIFRSEVRKNQMHPFTKHFLSGPKKIKHLAEYHGWDVIRSALHQSSPHSRYHDPRYAPLRVGFKMDRQESNQPFSIRKSELNNNTGLVLLKAVGPLLASVANVFVSHFLPSEGLIGVHCRALMKGSMLPNH